MLSLTRVDSGQASTYYKAEDYYLQEAGEWQGQLAEKLGYTGEIKESDFQKLIEGTDPKGNFQIQSGGTDHKHTAGVDLTFSAPKSVSIASLVLDDKRVLDAHNKAVTDTLNFIEKNYTEVRDNGVSSSVLTGNMAVAKFQHITSRELDPQLHTHCLVLNMTERDNGELRAMNYWEIYNNKMLLGQVYRSELAANLKDIGYQIETNNKGSFEIKGIPQELMDEFSVRSQQIKVSLEKLREEFPHLSESKLKEMSALDSRQSKQKTDSVDLKLDWQERAAKHDITLDKLLRAEKQSELSTNDVFINSFTMANELSPSKSLPQPRDKTSVDEIMKHAVNIATEHEAIAKKDDILRIASKLSVGLYRISDVEQAFNNSDNVIKLNSEFYTTKEIAEMEHGIVNAIERGKEQLPGILSNEAVQKGVADYELKQNFLLTGCQKKAVEHVLTSHDRVIAIQGDAGTGKTTMLDVVRTIAEAEKREIVGLSFTGKAASEIEDASKISSQTVSGLVHSTDNLHGKLVVIDEASMLSIKDMKAILNRCDNDTKVVLIGDTKQLQTIGQGKIFSSLQEKNAISTVRMSEVQRQKDANYKDIVDDLGNKKVEEAFNKLDAGNKIHEIKDHDERLNVIKEAYLLKPKETIIVTATNKDRDLLNRMIRQELTRSGKVKGDGIEYNTRVTKSLVGEEKSYGQSYAIGDLIIANRAGILGKSGVEGRVTAVNEAAHSLKVSTADGKFKVDLKEHGQNIQVYQEQNKVFAQGDKVLFLKNDKSLSVKNGQTGYIKSIRNDGMLGVKMDNGREISLNPKTQYKYLSHGYALTDYKAQGQTEKHVIYHADTKKGVNFNQAYVGITRGKESVQIYTDNKLLLLDAMRKDAVKTTTLDYTNTIIEEQKKLLSKPTVSRVYTSADDVVKHAVDISTEHTAVIEMRELLKVAGALSVGEHRVLELREAIAKNENLIKLDNNMYTTREIMAMEQRIVDGVKDGRGQVSSVVSTEQASNCIIEYEQAHGFELTAGQKEAVEHVLTSKDRIIAIQGDAGTGKTTMLDVVRTSAEAEKREIVGLSFTGKAASEIQEASQIKSSTIASLVHGKDDLKGKLVVIDEASMLSIKDMDSLLNRSDKDTKLVLIGDTKQLQTIGQGKIFSSLQENKIISTVRMSEVQRQTNAEYKEIVADLGNKKVEGAFNKLDAGNKIHEIKDHGERLVAIKDAYLAKTNDTIIVTGTNIDRNELNQLIRAELTQSGQVRDNGGIYLTREIKTIMGEEKYYAQSYGIGDLVVANGAGIIGKVGAEGRVMATNPENHTIKLRVGEKNYTVDLKQDGRHLKVYSEEQKEFAVGDKVLFLKNDKDLSVKNGQTGYIENIRKDGTLGIKIDNGKDVNVNLRTGYNYLSHGYALTDYKSQGQTEKHVIYHADTKKGVSFNQAYVGITRGKESVTIYTNNKESLLKQMKKEQNNKSTLDYTLDKALQKQDKAQVDRALPDKPLDVMGRFNKIAQTMVQSSKHDNERISDPTVVSKLDQKFNDKALDKPIDKVVTRLEQSNTKEHRAQVPGKEINKERNRDGFER